ncbi:hypothetical protein LK08_04960 [Streptomyces sp. MUSC 125]|nr:hypothetical protein LK08_04960 [Streptomyces sp. MUSC 125]
MTAGPEESVRAPHPLRAEAVRGFAPWAGGAILLTLGAMLTGVSTRWQGDWAETAAEAHNALLITVPLAAAAGCWQGGRERRRCTEELWGSAVRSPLARFLASALPVAFWGAAGYLCAVALAMVATWPFSQGDRPHLALLPEDTVTMLAAAVAGHVVGRIAPTRLAAPLLAMAGYVGLGVAGTGDSGPGVRLDPAFQALAVLRPVWWQPVAMAGWTGGLAVAAVLAHTARRRVTALVPLAAAAAAGVLLGQAGAGLWRVDTIAERQVCDTSTTPAVCVSARYPGMLPQVRDALSGITGKLRGVHNLPTRWVDRGSDPRAGEVQLPMLTPFGWSVVRGRLTDPKQYAWEAVMALQRHDCDDPDPRRVRADDAVADYLAPNPLQAAFDRADGRGGAEQRAELRRRRAARARLAGLGEEERRRWLSAYFATAGRCGPAGVPSL